MRKNSNIRLVKDVFNKENTPQFLYELDLLMQIIDYQQVEKLILRYGLENDPECITFLEDIKVIFEEWKNDTLKTRLIHDTKLRITKCYVCFFGKNVTAYKFFYKQRVSTKYSHEVVFYKEFAVFKELKNDCLVDFGVCNGFLNKEEMK